MLCVFAFSQCINSNTGKINDEKCKQMVLKTQEMFNNYYMIDNEQSYIRLDSALAMIDSMFLCNCNVLKYNLVANKIVILCAKKDYSAALEFTKGINDSLFAAPYLKYVFIKRIEAIEAQERGDSVTRNKLIGDIVVDLKNYLSIPSPEIDSVLALKNVKDIYRYEKHMAIVQYYYYRAQIEGTDKVFNELDSLRQSINGNQEFFDNFLKGFINEDFIHFSGL